LISRVIGVSCPKKTSLYEHNYGLKNEELALGGMSEAFRLPLDSLFRQ